MNESTDSPELLVVGLDGGSRPILEPFFQRGECQALSRLFEAGTSGALESQIPPWTASAWPSIYTGKNPGKHGVFDFLAFDGYDWDVVNASHVRERSVWELLSDHGQSSVVVNVPVTHPPRVFDGALVPGMTAPETPPCHPEGVLEDIVRACGDYRVYPQSGPEPNRSIEGYERTIELRGAAFRYLCRRFEPDFAFVQFQQTDTVFHERSGDKEAIGAVYRAVDREFEQILDALEPTNVMLLSDHGIDTVTGCEFRVNEFLREQGYVTAKSGGEGMPTWSRAWENNLLDGEATESHRPSVLERAMGAAANVGMTTQRVANTLETVALKKPIGRRVPNNLIRAGSEQVDFPASAAYMRSKSELGIRLNLAGREPNGQVPQSDYESVRAELMDSLSAVQTPDGEPMFDTVEPREQYFEGPEIDRGPDILTVPNDFNNAIVAGLGGPQFSDPTESWNHKRTGVIAAVGPDFDTNETIVGAQIYDIAPTICSVFDVPIDTAMDGEVLPVVDSSERREYPRYEPEPTVATEDGTVEDRLSDLGYL